MTAALPSDLIARLEAAREHIAASTSIQPRVGLILGSGLGAMAETVEKASVIPYEAIPGWPVSTVEGHAGRLVLGVNNGVPVAIMQGRVHLYEGYQPWEIVYPTRVLGLLGCETLVVTNAAGAINTDFSAGDLMLISDHINLQGTNANVGPNFDDLGPRFFDMTYAYDREYRKLALRVASNQGTELREGVYAAVLGPSYETPAEIRMMASLGADAVGMSTVPEVTAANHLGMRAVGISCLSNMAAGVLDAPLDHEEVMQTGERVGATFAGVIEELVAAIAATGHGDDSA